MPAAIAYNAGMIKTFLCYFIACSFLLAATVHAAGQECAEHKNIQQVELEHHCCYAPLSIKNNYTPPAVIAFMPEGIFTYRNAPLPFIVLDPPIKPPAHV